MVDIHIRDISDQSKRMAVVREILEKIGQKDLVFQVVPRTEHNSSSTLVKLEYFGTYRGAVNYHNEGYSGNFSTRSDEILIKIDSYVETRLGRYGDYPPYGDNWVRIEAEDFRGPLFRKQYSADEGKIWYVVIKTSDLINITKQASVEPVTVLKEIGA